MSINLLDLLKGQLTDNVVGQLASFTGESSTTTSSALGAILPSVLGSIVSKGATDNGAGALLNMIKDQNMNGSMFDDLGAVFSGGSATNGILDMGKSILSTVLGSNQSTFLNLIMKATGLGRESSSSMMSMVAPMVMSMIGKQVMKNGLNVGGLMKLLSGQKSFLSSALPAGMGSFLGFSNPGGASPINTPTPSSNADAGGGGGFLKWILLGLVGLLALGFFGMRTGCGAVDNAATAVTETTGDMVDAAGNAVKSIAGFTKDAAGNLVDEAGNIVHKAGEFTVDAAGNVVDATGNILAKGGEMASNAANAAGDAVKSAVGYTKDAAGNLVDEAGNIVHKAGEFTMDAAGNVVSKVGTAANEVAGNVSLSPSEEVATVTYSVDAATGNLVDSGGKVVLKAGEFKEIDGFYVDSKGNKIGQALAKVGAAIAGAAGKTADFFSDSFSDMFTKKTKTSYALSDIEWKTDGDIQRISNFSKAEVQGLANALKNHPEAKINVHAYTDDGGNSIKNKAMSGLRAKVVMDMLVALGVDKGQISSKGMSDKDAAKAGADAIEVVLAE